MKRPTITLRGARLLRVGIAVLVLLTATALVPVRADGPRSLQERIAMVRESLRGRALPAVDSSTLSVPSRSMIYFDTRLLPEPGDLLPQRGDNAALYPIQPDPRQMNSRPEQATSNINIATDLYPNTPNPNMVRPDGLLDNYPHSLGPNAFTRRNKGKTRRETTPGEAILGEIATKLHQSVGIARLPDGVWENIRKSPLVFRPSLNGGTLTLDYGTDLKGQPTISSESILAKAGIDTSSTLAVGPSYFANLNRLNFTPAAPIETPAAPPVEASPGDSIGVVLFQNQTPYTICIFGVDRSGNLYPTQYLFPQRFDYFFTYIGLWWRLYACDGSNFVLLGDVQVTQAFREFPITLTQMHAASTAQTPPVPRFELLEARYQKIGELQKEIYYTDPTLSALRAEQNKVALYFIYTDPIYLYVQYEVEQLYEQLYTTRPSYQPLITLSQQIGSWTDAPADPALLQDRYEQRQQLGVLQAQLEHEVADYLVSHSELATALAEVEAWLNQRLKASLSRPEIQAWFADWLTRFEQAYAFSMAPVEAELAQLFADAPLLKEFLEVDSQVTTVTQQFASHQAVLRVAQMANDVENNPSVAQALDALQEEYARSINAATGTTSFQQETERYYAQVNQVVSADPTLQDLESTRGVAVQALLAYRQVVHARVAICFAQAGELCDPYADSTVRELIYSDDTRAFIDAVGDFYELYALYQYTFSVSEAYQQLETEAQVRIGAALVPILPAVEAAREQYSQGVQSIPQMRVVDEAITDLGYTLRGQPLPTQLSDTALASSYPYEEFNTLLNRRSHLLLQLLGGSLVHLPVVVR